MTDAAPTDEDCLALLGAFGDRRGRRIKLGIPPGIEILRFIRDDREAHMRMLLAAKFGALAAINARPA